MRAAEGVVQWKYPVGRKLTCYVNPRNPSEAVIDRSFTAAQIVVMVLIPPLLFGVGILAYKAIMRQVKPRKKTAAPPE
jgi:hypothetical protein